MKRSPLTRKTPLETRTALKRTTALAVSPLARSALHASQAGRQVPARRRPKNTGPTAKVRALVRLRSRGICEWPVCGREATDIHHRLNRKQGGRQGEMAQRINQPAWLLHACRGHHRAVTSPVGAALDLAIDSGWLLREGSDALLIPVVSRHGRIWLTDNGLALTSDPAEEA